MGINTKLMIRQATEGEGRRISDLVGAAYGKYIARIGRPPLPMLDDYPALIACGVVWVLVQGAEVVGVLVLREEGDHLLLENIAVEPRHQGQGFRSKLLDFVEEEARSRGLGEIRLYTNEAMVENIAIYEKWGYRETSRESGNYNRVFLAKPVRG